MMFCSSCRLSFGLTPGAVADCPPPGNGLAALSLLASTWQWPCCLVSPRRRSFFPCTALGRLLRHMV
eukprot:2979137-Alexandrium_andersonii.AAC.1